MDAVTVEQLEEIEAALTRRMIEVFGLDTQALILDMTNFATFIDSGNQRAPIAQRGKAKQKRYDLRIVGLGLVATRDGGIPLLSRAYPGNKVDVTQFQPDDRGAWRAATPPCWAGRAGNGARPP